MTNPIPNPAPAGAILRSGLDADSQFVGGEDRDEFALLQQEYAQRFQPRAPEERFFVDTLIRNDWILRRLFKVEAHLWRQQSTIDGIKDGVPLGVAFEKGQDVFMRLQRRITLAERSYKDALAELRRIQASRPQPPAAAPPQPQENTTPTPKLASFPISPSPTRPADSGPASQSPSPAPRAGTSVPTGFRPRF